MPFEHVVQARWPVITRFTATPFVHEDVHEWPHAGLEGRSTVPPQIPDQLERGTESFGGHNGNQTKERSKIGKNVVFSLFIDINEEDKGVLTNPWGPKSTGSVPKPL